jgi:dCMP deaminase
LGFIECLRVTRQFGRSKNWKELFMTLGNWDKRYLSIAKEVSTWSKDPSTKVGAVITDRDGRIIAVGFNGFPKKIADTMHRRHDRNIKYKMTVHAEANVALIAGRAARNGTIYVHGAPICADCAGIIIQAGIKRVVATPPCPLTPPSPCQSSHASKIDWDEHGRVALEMLDEADLKFEPVERSVRAHHDADYLFAQN